MTAQSHYINLVQIDDSTYTLNIPNKINPDDPAIEKARKFLKNSGVSPQTIIDFENGLKNRM